MMVLRMVHKYKKAWDRNDPNMISALDDTPLWSAPFGQALLDAVPLRRGCHVLDIGTGLGYPALELAQRLDADSRVIGLDPWQAGLSRVRAKATIFGVTTCSVYRGIAESMPFADEAFNLIISNNGLNNVTNRLAAWRECYRVARCGASVVATENTSGSMAAFYETYAETLEAVGMASLIPAMNAQIRENRRPLEETMAIIRGAGFAIRRIKEHGFNYRFVDGTAMFHHFGMRMGFIDGFKSILHVNDRVRVFDILEAKLNEKAAKHGSLTLSIPFVCIEAFKN